LLKINQKKIDLIVLHVLSNYKKKPVEKQSMMLLVAVQEWIRTRITYRM